jgi:Cd2+/Zn2+-exporting ATPase
MTERTKLDIALLLPAVPDGHDACVRRLESILRVKKGIEAAHLVDTTSPGGISQICIHFDPEQLSLGEVRALALQAGVELDQQFGHSLLRSRTMNARQASSFAARAKGVPGILDVAVSPAGLVRIEFDRKVTNENRICAALRRIGVPLNAAPVVLVVDDRLTTKQETPADTHEHDHEGSFVEQSELLLAGICGVLLLTGWMVSTFSHASSWVPQSLYLTAYVCGGYFTFREALNNLLARRFEIDFLMFLAALGAASLGEWAEGALLLFLFSLGHALEHFAVRRAKRAIEALADLAPQTALVRRNGNTEEISVDLLKVADVVIVKPNERITADGFVIKGEGSVNEAPITGESVPVDKRPVADPQEAAANPSRIDAAHRVFAGTINNSGALEIQVTKLASESTLARVVQMVNEAETQKSPTQRFTETFERRFVPSVLSLVVVLLFAWSVIDETFSKSFYRAMAVLVAASPCALAISTPSAVLSGIARAARGGVLVKGGLPLEILGNVQIIAFDKTGTLTEGKPRLTDVVCAEGVSETELLSVTIAVELLSDHPLAAAVVVGGKARMQNLPTLQAHKVQSITGRGVKATVDGQVVSVGKESLFTESNGTILPPAIRESLNQLKASGRTTMIVHRGNKYLGVIGLMDTPRSSARRVIARLRELGMQRMIMLSGDNQQVANAVARNVGLDEAMGDLMPDDKVATIRNISESLGVAMVGDGVNDAPAMANATVGIAMGAAGSDVALETADVALMADDLNQLPFAVGLSRRTRQIIRQNLWLSLGMVAFLVPATILGLRLGPAVLLHEGSTLLVVLNALRLLGYQDEE